MKYNPKTLLLFGATGLVGQQVLQLALSDIRIARVIAPTRKALAAHTKLLNPVLDFNHLPTDADWWRADAVICALGTTRKQAGSAAAFRSVDFDLVLEIAKYAKNAGTRVFVLNSSLGANAEASNVYLQVKGDVERVVAALGFESLIIVRPSLLDGGPRPERRFAEELGITLSKAFNLLIPKRYRSVRTRDVARCMFENALQATPGTHVIESEAISHNHATDQLNQY
jgi:uncharacterized protein YbjT (DUF2867 family)